LEDEWVILQQHKSNHLFTMKKITLIFCALWVTCSAWAQQANVRLEQLKNARIPNQQKFIEQYGQARRLSFEQVPPVCQDRSSAKTSEDEYLRDTVVFTSYWDSDSPSRDECVRFQYYNPGPNGFINGSFEPFWVPLQNGDSIHVAVTHHAHSFNIPRRNNDFTKVWLEQLVVALTDQVAITGTADTFRVQVYAITGSRENEYGELQVVSTGAEPVVNQPWTLERFTLPLDVRQRVYQPFPIATYTEYPPKTPLRGSYLFAFETKRGYGQGQFSDDVLAIFCSGPAQKCDQGDSWKNEWYVSLCDVDTPTVGTWVMLRRFFFGNRQDMAPDIPAIFPIIYYESRFKVGMEDMDEALYETGDLRLYGNYPNPAPEFTNVVFEYNKNTTAEIEVLDLSGRVVYSSGPMNFAKGKHQYTIPTENLSCGTYHYLIKSPHGSVGSRILVDR
jgi:hypothetical protein